MYDISSSVVTLGRVGDAYAKRFEKLQIYTIYDLLTHIPFRYEDRSKITKINTLQAGELVSVQAVVVSSKNIITKYGKSIQEALIKDDSGSISIVWYNMPFITKSLKGDTNIYVYGKVDFFGSKRAFISPDIQVETTIDSPHTKRLVPIYHETSGVSSKYIRSIIWKIIPLIPSNIYPSKSPYSWQKIIKSIHFPEAQSEVEPSRLILALNELTKFQILSEKKLIEWSKDRSAIPLNLSNNLKQSFISKIPFILTKSQQTAIQEILTDLANNFPTNRLLAGDVGSGKTIVAATAAFAASQNNLKTLFLAPTQILATQHYQTLTKLFSPLGVQIGLVTGASKSKIENLKFQIVVGTHSLLNSKLDVSTVGLVIIDEQHKFGVAQRTLASQKGIVPHVLTMSATPIPRTLTLALHGELAVSTLKKERPDIIPIKTWVIPEQKRVAGYEWIKKQVQTEKSQVFIVCPFIEPSETQSTVKSATIEFQKLSEVFKGFKLGLLHGKIKNTE